MAYIEQWLCGVKFLLNSLGENLRISFASNAVIQSHGLIHYCVFLFFLSMYMYIER